MTHVSGSHDAGTVRARPENRTVPVIRTSRPARDVATEADLLTVAGPVRRAVQARLVGRSGIDPDDVVQETLARVWAARWRLERGTLVAYGLVVARNLVTSADRRTVLDRRHPALAPTGADGDPAVAVLAAEERVAVGRAVAALRAEDRRLLLEHEVDGIEVRKIAAEDGVPPATVAARLARARARLRVEHLLAFRGAALPTARCRGVLDALSLGDRARQRRLLAAEHLLGCATCAALAEPLLTRRRSLTALAPVGLLLVPARWVKANPVPVSAAGVAAVAVVAAVVAGGPSDPPAVAAPAPAVTTAAAAVVPLSSGGVDLLPAGPAPRMVGMVGRTAVGRDVPVQAVPADEGFWVGAGPGRRVWVQLAAGGGESAVRVRAGQRASFTAEVRAVPAGGAARLGVSAAEGAAELTAAGAYLVVDPDRLVLR